MKMEMDMNNERTTREAAVKLIEAVVTRWAHDLGHPVKPLAEVLLSAGIDLHVRAMGEEVAADLLRRVADDLVEDEE